jgi:hypothetical protein
MTATTVNVTPVRCGLSGNTAGEVFLRIPQTAKGAQDDFIKVLGYSGITEAILYEVGAPTLRETCDISSTSNSIKLTSANTGHVRGYVIAKI